MIRIVTVAGLAFIGLSVALTGVWGALALLYASPHTHGLNTGLAAAFALVTLLTLLALVFRRWRWRALTAHLLLSGLLLLWWSSIAPSNERDWHVDMSRLPYVTNEVTTEVTNKGTNQAGTEGDIVKVHNIRNFDYRSETDYTPAWYDKSFDLRKLEGVDLVAVYWMGPAIAHIFVSFAFAGGDQLAISIEARKEKGEGYSTLKGFFRQYELFYVVADERDVIRLRTNYRKDPPEDVYIYKLRGSVENARRLFTEYINKINDLYKNPEFYNTLTTNCTTNIWFHTRVNPGHLPFSWKILASGYVPQYIYESGMLDTRIPFPELQRRALVNPQAQTADKASDFSRRIRTPPESSK